VQERGEEGHAGKNTSGAEARVFPERKKQA
jgi:hypothetical protein